MLKGLKARLRRFLLSRLEPHLNVRGLKTVPLDFDKALVLKQFEEDTRWLRRIPFQTILDVGASKGHTARTFRRFWPDAQIVAFEPLEACFFELCKRFADDPRFKAHHSALGASEGVADIHRNEFSNSSSLLPMEELHKESFPFTKNSTPERIKIQRLDEVVDPVELKGPGLLKLDVQGFEGEVLRGGLEVLKRIDVVITEMSVAPLYQGQIEFDELYRMLVEQGFRYQGNYEQLRHPADGRILQVDGIFIREQRLGLF